MNDRGFSLIELMIAMVILTVGVLGLAGSARLVTSMTGRGGRYGGSAAVAGSRFERLRATPCASLADGSGTTGKYTEAWTITTDGLLRTINLTITYPDGNATRTAKFSTTISCAPKSS